MIILHQCGERHTMLWCLSLKDGENLELKVLLTFLENLWCTYGTVCLNLLRLGFKIHSEHHSNFLRSDNSCSVHFTRSLVKAWPQPHSQTSFLDSLVLFSVWTSHLDSIWCMLSLFKLVLSFLLELVSQ